jgi:hypothetical protein
MQHVKHVTTLLDLRIAPDNKGIPPGTLELVRAELAGGEADGKIDYAIFLNDEYLASLEASTEPEAAFEWLVRIRDLLLLFSQKHG